MFVAAPWLAMAYPGSPLRFLFFCFAVCPFLALPGVSWRFWVSLALSGTLWRSLALPGSYDFWKCLAKLAQSLLAVSLPFAVRLFCDFCGVFSPSVFGNLFGVARLQLLEAPGIQIAFFRSKFLYIHVNLIDSAFGGLFLFM